MYAAECKFISDAETVEEAYQAAYSYGFACLRKLHDKDIVANAQLSVRLSSVSIQKGE